MIFTEIRFVLLIVFCWATFFAVAPRWRAHVLAFWGIVFYVTYASAFLPLVLGLTLLTYFAQRRLLVWIVGAMLIALLAFFKLEAGSAAVLAPLGFSFLAFELLHVLIEKRRGHIGHVAVADVLAYAFFFPARVAGPIKRLPEFLAAVSEAERSFENIYAGSVRVLLGLAKKLLIADLLALTVAERGYAATASHAWLVIFAYAFQIFFDFSAYSDIAIGFARILGIRLPENFAAPYLAPNIREFWNRWHITLSHWVRDYVFIPSSRRLFQTALRPWPIAIAVLGYLLTFVAVGAWHGLTAAFLVWGLYHGALLSAHHIVRASLPASIATHPLYHSRVAHVVSMAVTFLCVAIGWVPFMDDLKTARRMLALMFGIAT